MMICKRRGWDSNPSLHKDRIKGVNLLAVNWLCHLGINMLVAPQDEESCGVCAHSHLEMSVMPPELFF